MIVIIDEIVSKHPLKEILNAHPNGKFLYRGKALTVEQMFDRKRIDSFKLEGVVIDSPNAYGYRDSIWLDEGVKGVIEAVTYREVIVVRARHITIQTDTGPNQMGLVLDVVSPEIADAVGSNKLPNKDGNTLEGFLEAVGCL